MMTPAITQGASVPQAPPATVLVVDGNAVIHRAFYARVSSEYADSGAIAATRETRRAGLAGMLTLLNDIVNQVEPTETVVAFDAPTGNFRRIQYPAYKAQRPAKSQALLDLLDAAPALLDELGIGVECETLFEADDVCASVAKRAEQNGKSCVIATGDRDAFSLITEQTRVLHLVPGLGNHRVMDLQALHKRYGIQAFQYVQFAALRGDPSDNLPGVKGIGEKRAAALLAAYGTIEAAVADPTGCKQVLGPKLGGALIEDWHTEESLTRRNLELMTIRTDVPLRRDDYSGRPSMDTIRWVLEQHGLGALAWQTCMTLGEAETPPFERFEEPLPFGDDLF